MRIPFTYKARIRVLTRTFVRIGLPHHRQLGLRRIYQCPQVHLWRLVQWLWQCRQ